MPARSDLLHPLFLLVVGAASAAAALAVTANRIVEPAWALYDNRIYRAEIGLAAFLALYGLIVVMWLAAHRLTIEAIAAGPASAQIPQASQREMAASAQEVEDIAERTRAFVASTSEELPITTLGSGGSRHRSSAACSRGRFRARRRGRGRRSVRGTKSRPDSASVRDTIVHVKQPQEPERPVSYLEQTESENLRRIAELGDEIFEAGKRAAEHLRRAAELMGPAPPEAPRR